MITLQDIQNARERIRPHLYPTPLEPAPGLAADAWLKLENANSTHSFKIRGALNAALSLSDEEKARGLVAASSGNHAQALAYAAKLAQVEAVICMPNHTPRRKVEGAQRWGAITRTDYANYDDAEADALRLAQEENRTFVSAYNHPQVIAGAGTIGLEILDELPEVARVVVCVSGGGLIAGVATAVKSLRPDVEVIGVCAQNAPSMYNAFYSTNYPEVWKTLAEALSGGIEAGSITVPLVKQYVDHMVLVTEAQIASAIRWCANDAGWLVEGGGAVGVAALLSEVIPDNGQQTAVVVSGGNIDGDTLRDVLMGVPY